jgi:hypothetical protein
MDMYRQTATLLPEEARRETFRERMVSLSPFHPTLTDYFAAKLSTVETFQGARGVLRVLTLTASHMARKRVAAPRIHAYHIDLRDPRLSDEFISRTESAERRPIVTADIGDAASGDLSAQDTNAPLANRHNTHLGSCSTPKISAERPFQTRPTFVS